MDNSSKELQRVALISLLNDNFILGKCCSEIQEDYFENDIYRVIYSCLKSYYLEYSVSPSKEELLLSISNACRKLESKGNELVTFDMVSEQLDSLLNAKLSSGDFVYSQVIAFIRKNRLNSTLQDIIHCVDDADLSEMDRISAKLSSDISINLNSRNEVYNLSEIDKISEIKKDALGDADNPLLIPFFIDGVNKKMQYKALPPATLNMVSASPGCGKTTLMINQGMFVAQQGYKVLHMFLGDMSIYDGFLRYLSNISGAKTSDLVDYTDAELASLVRKCNMTGALGNVTIASYAQGELNATQVIEEIQKIQNKNKVRFDMIIIDYDENISKDDEDNIYESGGLIYNKLGLFAVANKSVVFIVAQPKQQYWGQEIIPLEATAESSKKQKIIDLMITMGKPSRSSSVGTIFIAKNRRGEVGSTFKIKMNGANTRISHISQAEYDRIRASEINEESASGE